MGSMSRKFSLFSYICRREIAKMMDNPDPGSFSLLLLYFIGTLVISFICSMLESVLMTTPLSYATMRKGQGSKAAERFLRYKQDIDKPLSAILSLNTIANVFGATGVGRQATLLFGSTWYGIISALMTLLILVFCEVFPKTIGTYYYKQLMTPATKILNVLVVVMWPFVKCIGALNHAIAPKGSEDEASVSRDEVSAMANMGKEEGVIEEDENRVIQNLMNLDDVEACDAMTPRIVAAIAQENMSLKNFYKNDDYLHYSRIPLYNDSPEYITGYVLLSEILEALADDQFDTRLRDYKRKVSLFREDVPLSEGWDKMLAQKEQMAVVVDEYGCFQGILTLEDIIETIFGLEITDENDKAIDMQQYARDRWQRRQKRYTQIILPEEEDDKEEDE